MGKETKLAIGSWAKGLVPVILGCFKYLLPTCSEQRLCDFPGMEVQVCMK